MTVYVCEGDSLQKFNNICKERVGHMHGMNTLEKKK